MERYLFIGGALYRQFRRLYDFTNPRPGVVIHYKDQYELCYTKPGETNKDRAIKDYLAMH